MNTPSFNRNEVEAHVSLLHDLAEGCNGVLILAGFEEGGRPSVQRFRIGDVANMIETIMGFDGHPRVNLYTPWAVMRSDLDPGKKGAETDVIAVLAAVGDLDNDKYQIGELPVEAPYIVESSPGNFQPVYVFERPLPPSEAKPVLTAICDFVGGDSATKDCSHVWRIAGTRNIPTKSKLARGRSPVPAPVTIKKPYDGRFISPAALLALAPAPRRPNGHDTAPFRPPSFAEEARLRDALKFIPADDRNKQWRPVCMALHTVGARALCDEWSKTSDKFDADEQEKAWTSFNDDHEPRVTLATIYHMAREYGWRPSEPFFREGSGNDAAANPSEPWPQSKPIPAGLLPVMAFETAFLPDAIAPWVLDIADRMQCPLDFVGVAAIATLGAVLGRKVGVRPKQHDDWTCVSNFWAAIVGAPGAMKSPAMEAVLKPVRYLEKKAADAYAEAKDHFDNEMEFFELMTADAKKKARKAGALRQAYEESRPEKPTEPKQRRYLTSDTSYEKLGMMLADNPNGLMAHRDELISLWRHLDAEDQVCAKSFFMTAGNGNDAYTFDRVVRGTVHIEHACLSLLGGTQPHVLAEYVRDVHRAKTGGDGFIQRFALGVWPDLKPEWVNVDERPDREARDAAWDAFERLDKLTPETVEAETDRYQDLPFLRFGADAQGVFNAWLQDVHRLMRDDELMPALQSHFSKYPKLVPGLALLNHLAEPAAKGPIPVTAIRKAICFARYLESHARRIYASGSEGETSAAKAILAKICKGDLRDGFSARDVHRPRWSNLSDREDVQAGLDLLCDLHWTAEEERKPGSKGGRPSTVYRINPTCLTWDETRKTAEAKQGFGSFGS